jgi:DNA-directed RNA polymerase sigma subunit (sigma70/sigma32)
MGGDDEQHKSDGTDQPSREALEEVAQRFRATRERIREIEARAMRRFENAKRRGK